MNDPNIRLSDAARAFAEAKAREAGFTSADEFVEAIIQKAIRREARRKRLDELLIEGLESGPPMPMDWAMMRLEAIARQVDRARIE